MTSCMGSFLDECALRYRTDDKVTRWQRDKVKSLIVCKLTIRGCLLTMSCMKRISIRELHRRTGMWVRNAPRYGAILVTDRNVAVAQLIPIAHPPPMTDRFKLWKPLKKFAAALDRSVLGRAVEEMIS